MLEKKREKKEKNLCQLDAEIAYLGKLISPFHRAHDHKNGIWNNPICLVIPSLCDSIYLNMTDYETRSKTHGDIKYE